MPELRLPEKPGHLFGKVMRIFSYKPKHVSREKSKHASRKMNAKVLTLAIVMALVTQLTMPIISFNSANHLALAAGNTYYVSTSGNDSNQGTQSAPFRTIQKGVNTAQAGDTVLVRGGTYNEAVSVNSGGTSSARKVIKNYPGETPVLDGQNSRSTGFNFGSAPYVTIEGFTIRNFSTFGISNQNGSAHAMHVVGNTIHNTGSAVNDAAIRLAYGNSHQIRNNLIRNINSKGIHTWNAGNNYLIQGNELRYIRADALYIGSNSSNLYTSFIVDGNHFHHVGVDANDNAWAFGGDHVDHIQAQQNAPTGLVIRNNKFGRVLWHQVIVKDVRNVQMYNNLWYDTYKNANGGGTLRIENTVGGTMNFNIYNNTVASLHAGHGAFLLGSGQSAKIYNNIVQGGGNNRLTAGSGFSLSQGNNFIGNPPFANFSAKDFRLAGNATGCITKGTNSPPGITLPSTDHDGNTRIVNGTVDIGAYEYGATGGTTPAPTEPNLALNKPAHSSASSSEMRAPTKAVDGDKTTYWAVSASQGLPQWWYVDLGKNYELNKVRITSDWYAYASAYKISVSNDAVNWKQAYSTTTGKGSTEEIPMPGNTIGRYVRLDVTAKSNTPYGFGVHEFEVYGKETSQDTTPPKVAITEPVNNATVSGQVNIKATASDDKGVQKVEFYIDGALKKTASASPYEYTWDSANVSNGTHKILTKAYDTSGNTASAEVTVNVSNPVADTAAPVTEITDPTGAETLTGSEKLIKGTTTDNVGVSKVEVAIQRENGDYWTGSGWSASQTWLPATITSGAGTKTATWSYGWKIDSSDNVTYKIKARGTDTSGNVEDTALVGVNVDNVAPSGTITVNSGAASTTDKTVTVANSITGASKMRFSIDGGSTWTAWENYANSKTLTLTDGLGVKTVKGRFSDGVNVYETSASIELKAATAKVSVTYPAGWNLVAVPTGNDIGTDLFGNYDPKTGSYKEVTSPSTGEGYWAHFSQPTTVTLTFDVIDKFDINLKSGWNMVGNPFDRNVALPQGYTAHVYDPAAGSYKTTNVIPKGSGAWIYVSSQKVLTLNR